MQRATGCRRVPDAATQGSSCCYQVQHAAKNVIGTPECDRNFKLNKILPAKDV